MGNLKQNFNGHLSCIKSTDGMPLFSRASSDSKTLPIQILSTLNSIYTYGENYGFRTHSVDSKNFKIIWKNFHSSITLILVEELMPIDDRLYNNKLDLLFDAMILFYGLDDLINITNIEKFKKEIKIVYGLLDTLLDNSGKYDLFGGYMTDCVDLILVNDISVFNSALNSSCVSVNTSYACLLVSGRIIAASQSWWELKPIEAHLISLLCLCLSGASSRDIPIYLPHKSPHQPLRLLTFNLSSNEVTLCFICSEKPNIDAVEPIVKKIWHPIYKHLINLKEFMPRNLPTSISMDQNMIGFLLINKTTKCCTSSLCPNDKICSNLPIIEAKKRYKLLRQCYMNISSKFFKKFSNSNTVSFKSDNKEEEVQESINCPEAYILISGVKCYALNEPYYEFYALYNQSIPTHAVRGVTKFCLNVLINS